VITEREKEGRVDWYIVVLQGKSKDDKLLITSYCDRDLMWTKAFQIHDDGDVILFSPRPDLVISYPIINIWHKVREPGGNSGL
jgi:hypothetical protein